MTDKNIVLHEMRLKNFKGLQDVKVKFDAKDNKVFGDNETGKTTLQDAFLWVLFGKDSQNKTDFDIKTLDEDNNVIHGLEHEVEAKLSINKAETFLKKVYKENWTKKRGEAERTLTGHTTDYFINHVPVKKKEYDEYINNIVDEDIFKLITNVLYFNTQLDWKKRRGLLIEICGDITDESVIESNTKLNNLKTLLNDTSIENLRDQLKARKSLLNKSIKEIPIRIDELNNSIKEQPDTKGIEGLTANAIAFKNQIEKLDNEILELTNSQQTVNNKAIKVSNIKAEINNIRNNAKSNISKTYNTLKQELESHENIIVDRNNKIKRLEVDLDNLEEKLKGFELKKQDLYKEFDRISAIKFEIGNESRCDKCGQDLPTDKIKEIKDTFDKNKKADLDAIRTNGISNNECIVKTKEQIEKTKESIREFEENKKELMDVIAKANKSAEAEKLKIDTFDITTYTDDEITNLEIELGKLEGELENPSESLKAELKAKMDKKKEDEAELKKFEDELTAIDQKVNLHQKNIERVAELKEEEKSLACQIAELEGQEFLTEEFIRTKVNLFDEKINSKFKLAKFKMFNTLVNGALDETCECTFKGVPFSSINSAAKINVGLDIINVLSEHYGLKTPIFVDNAESVTRLNTIDCQTIATYVLDKDAELPKAVGNIIRMEDLK